MTRSASLLLKYFTLTVLQEPIRENPLDIFPTVIKNNFNVPESELSEISRKVKSFYFGDDDQADDKLQKMMRVIL